MMKIILLRKLNAAPVPRGGLTPACSRRAVRERRLISVLITAILLVTASVTLASQAPSSTQQQTVRRYLLSAGANHGGRDKVVLRYAVSDANAFASVLNDMGGIDRENSIILADPSRRELLRGIDSLNKLIADPKNNTGANVRSEVFVYYSGHADDDGLRLASETLGWSEFRKAVSNIRADVRVAVLDACGSGAITRTKGGTARPAFLSDASMNMTGYAFITSSNENEVSQESDRIKGSYFTHALLSGIRGAADMTGDGKVTINEAYQYAFNETLSSTQNTRAGTQHPSRDMNLAGTGDVIMTDLRQTSATLLLDSGIEGRFFIRDDDGNLFAELRKARGRTIEIGIPPGRYTVQTETPSRAWLAGELLINSGGRTELTMGDMRPMGARRRTVSRGGSEEGEDSLYADEADYACGEDDLPGDFAIACEEEAWASSVMEELAAVSTDHTSDNEKSIVSQSDTPIAADTADVVPGKKGGGFWKRLFQRKRPR